VLQLWKDTRILRDNRLNDLESIPDKKIIIDDISSSVKNMINMRDKAKFRENSKLVSMATNYKNK
jgi:hypothetical protein